MACLLLFPKARVTRTIHRLTAGRKGEHHGLRSDPDPQQYIDGDSHLHRDYQDLAGLIDGNHDRNSALSTLNSELL